MEGGCGQTSHIHHAVRTAYDICSSLWVFGMFRILLCCVLSLYILPATARDVDGIAIPDSVTLAGEAQPLVLNGAGYRKKFFIKVYIGALYLAHPTSQAEVVLDASMPRVMRLHFLRDVAQDQFTTAWNDGLTPNHTPAEMDALRLRLNHLNTLIGNLRQKEVLRIEMRPNGQTEVWVNDLQRGIIKGVDFQNALLKAWVGVKPTDAQLKQAVLGAKE